MDLLNKAIDGTLDLPGNRIGPEEAGALAEALKVNQTLHTLILWANDIGPEGMGALAEALKVNTTLHTLDLRYNGIGATLEGGGSIGGSVESKHHPPHFAFVEQ